MDRMEQRRETRSKEELEGRAKAGCGSNEQTKKAMGMENRRIYFGYLRRKD